MERIGEITAVKGSWVEVTFCRPTDCGHCHACMGTKKETTVRVKGQGGLGDMAVVTMPASTVLQASALAYVMPLVTLMLGMFAGATLFPQSRDAAGGIGAVIGLAIGLGIILITEKSRENDPHWRPTLKEVIPAKKKKETEAAENGVEAD